MSRPWEPPSGFESGTTAGLVIYCRNHGFACVDLFPQTLICASDNSIVLVLLVAHLSIPR